MRRHLVLSVATVLTAASPAAAASAGFAPEVFFAGPTHSDGVLLDGEGRVTDRFTGDTSGRREPDGSTVFDQTIRFADGTTRRRSFRLVRTGPTSLEATGSEVVGTAQGTLAGRSLRLLSTIRTDGNPLKDVLFDQTFTLSSDGRRLRNVSTVTKLGFVLARSDETFAALGSARGRLRSVSSTASRR